jgi:hypothetical protein
MSITYMVSSNLQRSLVEHIAALIVDGKELEIEGQVRECLGHWFW